MSSQSVGSPNDTQKTVVTTKTVSKKRRWAVAFLQLVLLLGIVALIFFKVPAVNKIAQRKPDQTPAGSSKTSLQTNGTANSTNANTSAGTPGSAAAGASEVGEYAVSVYHVDTDQTSGIIAITLEINNPSKVVLQFDPSKQFKLVGLKTKQEKLPVQQAGKPSIAAGDIKPGQTAKGILYVQRFQAEDYELRFFPQINDKDYTVVPLIAVPADQQTR